ncbi:MAG: hypothetical protein IT438_15560 [Phycisphaerales bacterium]|nr:hypothetical protein [Phycisphaerales bacterium]
MQNGQPSNPPEHIRIMCPNLTCKRILAVPGASRGKNVRCKSCGATIRVPQKNAKVEPPKPQPDAKAA